MARISYSFIHRDFPDKAGRKFRLMWGIHFKAGRKPKMMDHSKLFSFQSVPSPGKSARPRAIGQCTDSLPWPPEAISPAAACVWQLPGALISSRTSRLASARAVNTMMMMCTMPVPPQKRRVVQTSVRPPPGHTGDDAATELSLVWISLSFCLSQFGFPMWLAGWGNPQDPACRISCPHKAKNCLQLTELIAGGH